MNVAVNINDIPRGTGLRAPDNPPFTPPQRLQGFLAPGTVIAAGDTNGIVVPILGVGRFRVIALLSAAGTLQVKFRLADHVTDQATNQPATVPLVAATENVLDVTNNQGYAYAEITVVNGGAPSTVSYVDVVRSIPGN